MKTSIGASNRLKMLACVLVATLTVLSSVDGLSSSNPNGNVEAAALQGSFTISPNPLPDIPGGAQSADLGTAAMFAWQQFFAMNWPAKAGVRDTPDTSKFFGDGNLPLVWQTQRSKVEIYPGNGSATVGPHGFQKGAPDYGYDDSPQYIYKNKVGPCAGQAPVTSPAWINLDEVSQISLDSMFAGIVPPNTPGNPSNNSQPRLIRFMAKANKNEYTYVVSNTYWYKSKSLTTAQGNFITAITSVPPKAPTQAFVYLPDGSSPAGSIGTIETKAAWRKLGPSDNPSRFHTATVRYYESGPCWREDTWALIALHIIQKTPTAPSFIFATFEQADNIQTCDPNTNKCVSVEDENGKGINPPRVGTPTTPDLTYKDDPQNPLVSIVGSTYCQSPGSQIYYSNISGHKGLPAGTICVNSRSHAIPPVIITVNQAAHKAIQTYNSQNKITQSPWPYYKLVNVQYLPFDKSRINTSDPNGKNNPSTYYQANIVVETNYTLQFFSGRIAANGAPTDYTGNGSLGFQNVYTFSGGGTPTVKSVNMGGCMGCHGNAQVGGSDFSFILKQSSVTAPETPSTPKAALVKKYKSLFKTR